MKIYFVILLTLLINNIYVYCQYGYKCGENQVGLCKEFNEVGLQCTCAFRKGRKNICRDMDTPTCISVPVGKVCFNSKTCDISSTAQKNCDDICSSKGFTCNSKICSALKVN